jgi:hypothetical protein
VCTACLVQIIAFCPVCSLPIYLFYLPNINCAQVLSESCCEGKIKAITIPLQVNNSKYSRNSAYLYFRDRYEQRVHILYICDCNGRSGVRNRWTQESVDLYSFPIQPEISRRWFFPDQRTRRSDPRAASTERCLSEAGTFTANSCSHRDCYSLGIMSSLLFQFHHRRHAEGVPTATRHKTASRI